MNLPSTPNQQHNYFKLLNLAKSALLLLLMFGAIEVQAQQCTGNTTLTSVSGTITDGPGSYNNNQRCTWLIQPVGTQAIALSFSQFFINTNDTLYLYNGTDSTGTLLGRFNGFTAPAARTIVASSLFVKFRTNGNGVLPGFSLDYNTSNCLAPTITASGPLAIPAGQTITLSATAGADSYIWSNGDTTQTTNINTAGTYTVRSITGTCTSLASNAVTTTNTTCSGNVTLTSTNGAFTDGPGNYLNNINCTWLLQSPGALFYRIAFTQISINNSDTLIIYNGTDSTGTIVGRYTGTTNPGIIAVNGSSAFIRFRTNATGIGIGFVVTYNSSACATPVISASGPLAIPFGQSITLTTTQIANSYLWSNGDTTQSISVNAADTYTLRTITAGCTSLVSNAIVTTLVSCSGNSVLNSVSGTISDGPGQYDNNSNCTWLIQPTGATSITLTFTGNFNLEANNDILRVYQGTDTTGTLVATLTGTANPGIISVTGGAMFVQLRTNGTITRGGFVANYSISTCAIPNTPVVTATNGGSIRNGVPVVLSIPTEPNASYLWSNGDTTNSITVSTAGNFSVRVIIAGCTSLVSNTVAVTVQTGCNGLTILTTPSGSFSDGVGAYQNNANCKFLVQVPGATFINLTLTEFNLEAGWDFLEIFQGTDSTGVSLGRFSGTVIPGPIQVQGNSAFVKFTSDGSQTRAGWAINYISGNCVVPPTPSITPSDTIDLNTVTSRVITSSEASAGMSYLWSTGDTTRSITVTTTGNYSVRIINGVCTSTVSNVVVAIFNVPQCSGNTTLISNTGTITDGQGQYSDNQRCEWLVSPSVVNSITFNFLSFNTEQGFDFVQIFDGIDATAPSLGRWSGINLPPSVTVNGSAAFVVFTTDGSAVRDGFILNYQGVVCPNAPAIPTITADGPTTFRTGGSVVIRTTPIAGVSYLWGNGSTADTLNVTATGLYRVRAIANGCTSGVSAPIGVSVLTGCNGITTLNTPTGSITDGTGNYENNANCKFLVQIPGATFIDFSFSQFNTQANSDFVRIYQGTDSLGTLVGTFSGAAIPAGVTVVGSSAFVQFISNGVTVNTGYVLNYISGDCALPPTPTITASGPLELPVTGGSVTLSANQIAGARYLWSTGDTTVSITVSGPGTYSVRIIVGTCSSAISNGVVVTQPQCSGGYSLTALTGLITDGQGIYSDNQRCSWLVAPTGANVITFNFLTFVTEQGWDFVEIFEGPDSTARMLGSFSGTTLPASITVNGGQAWVRFRTDGSGTREGFTLNYTGTFCPAPPTPVLITNRSPNITFGDTVVISAPDSIGYSYLWSNGAITSSIRVATAGSYSVRIISGGCTTQVSQPIVVGVNNCSGFTRLTSPSGTIGDGPANYVDNMNCSWHLNRPGATNIRISFSQFNTEAGSDLIRIYRGADSLSPLIATYSGATIPTALNVPSDNVYILFTSNGTVTRAGFTLNYVITGGCLPPPTPTIAASGPIEFCEGGSVTLSAPAGYSAYLWSNGATSQSITVSEPNNYTVRVTENSCLSAASDAVVVALTTNPSGPTITASGPLAICQGGSVTLSVPTATAYIWNNGANTQSIVVDTPGVYFVRLVTGTCTTLPARPVQITIATPPARPLVGYYLRDSLRASVVAASYEWRFEGNIIPPTTRTIRIIGDGLYSAVAIDAQGCRSTVSTEFLVNAVKTALANDIVMYPNPAANNITIGTKGSVLKSVAIVTLEGKTMLSQKLIGTEIQLPLNLPAGVYLAKIETSLGTHYERLVIK